MFTCPPILCAILSSAVPTHYDFSRFAALHMLGSSIAMLSIQSTIPKIRDVGLGRRSCHATLHKLNHATWTTQNLPARRTSDRTPQQAGPMDTLLSWKIHQPTPANNYIRPINQAYPSRSLYFSPLLSNASSNRCITPSTFSSSSLRPITCTPTGSPAIFTAS